MTGPLLAKGSITALAQQAVRVLTGIVSVPLALSYLDREHYGLWILAISTMSFVNFFDLGMTPILKNRMAESLGTSDDACFRRNSSAASAFSVLTLAVGGSLVLPLSLVNWQSLLNTSAAVSPSGLLRLVQVVFLSSVLVVSLSFVDSVYAASGRIATLKVAEAAGSVAGLGALILAIQLRASLAGLALLVSLPPILSRLLLLVVLVRRDPAATRPAFGTLRAVLPEVLPLSLSFLGIKLAEALLVMLPNLLAARLIGVTAVANLGVGQRLATLPLMAVTAMLPAFWPEFTVAYARGERESLWRRLCALSGISVALFAAYSVLLLAVGPLVVRFWTADKVELSGVTLMALGLWAGAQGLFYWFSTLLHSVSDFHFELAVHFLVTAGFLLAGIVITRGFGLPGIGFSGLAAVGVLGVLPLAERVRSRLEGTWVRG